MAWSVDARIPVTVFDSAAALAAASLARPGVAVLLPEAAADVPGVASARFGPAGHMPDCNCCGGRLPAAVALDRLFLDRVRGAAPFFPAVVALDGGQVRQALAEDAVASARFRLAG